MTLKEKILYHQIHPLKLVADIGCEPASLYFIWRHDLLIGLITHFGPPVAASLYLIRFGDLGACKHSRAGTYLRLHMTRPVEVFRFIGDVIMAGGAWRHRPLWIGAGLAVIFSAWGSGLVLGPLLNTVNSPEDP